MRRRPNVRTCPALLNILKCQGKKKNPSTFHHNPPLESQMFNPLIQRWEYDSALISHLAVCKITISLGSALRERRRETVGGESQHFWGTQGAAAAVSDAITPRISISPLMSITLGLSRWASCFFLPVVFFLTGKLSKCYVPERGYRQSSKYSILPNKRGTV